MAALTPGGARSMLLTEILKDICKMEEVKKSTPVTRAVLQSAHKVLAILEGVECEVKRTVTEFDWRLSQDCSNVLGSLQRYKLQSVRADRMWVMFHKFSLQEGLKLCKFYDNAIDLKAHDVFWQLVMEKRFLSMFIERSTPSIVTCEPDTIINRNLSSVEESAIYYTAGYVVKKLIRKYSRKGSPKTYYLGLLKGMGCKISDKTSAVECGRSSEWTKLVDRGGLFHVNNAVYDLFVFLDMTVDEKLTSIFKTKGRGIEKVRREKLDWLCENEEIQLVWSIVTDLEESDDDFNDLLKEIASLWITTRGYSKAHMVKEEYKRAKATSTRGKKGLRKELKRKNTESVSSNDVTE